MRVPTFDEALEIARGKIGIYVDTKDASAQDLIAAIEVRQQLVGMKLGATIGAQVLAP